MIRQLKSISWVLCFTMLMTMLMSSMAFASEESQKEAYYAQYEKIIQEVGQQYNTKLSLMPIEDFNEEDMLPPDKFKEEVINNCKKLNNATKTYNPELIEVTPSNISTKAAKMYTYTDTRYNSGYGVTITFQASINVKEDPESGTYYWGSCVALEPNLTVSKENVGASVSSFDSYFLDGGRSWGISTNIKIFMNGVVYNKSAAVEWYLNKTTGVVSVAY